MSQGGPEADGTSVLAQECIGDVVEHDRYADLVGLRGAFHVFPIGEEDHVQGVVADVDDGDVFPATRRLRVDLSFDIKPGVEEMEMYPVNEPYAYVRVIYDHSTHEYTYQVIEPVLSEPEKDLLKEIKERLFETLDINTKDISKEEARRRSGVQWMISCPITG